MRIPDKNKTKYAHLSQADFRTLYFRRVWKLKILLEEIKENPIMEIVLQGAKEQLQKTGEARPFELVLRLCEQDPEYQLDAAIYEFRRRWRDRFGDIIPANDNDLGEEG